MVLPRNWGVIPRTRFRFIPCFRLRFGGYADDTDPTTSQLSASQTCAADQFLSSGDGASFKTMIDPESLTEEVFLETLRERVDELRMLNADVPLQLHASVAAVLERLDDPFGYPTFRLAAAHLLDGLNPEMAEDDEEGLALLSERLWALPANLRESLKLAAVRREQHV
jgi:hypothetical protein